ncbi:bifunctional serine/threonine-protein kinase/formylglycine-generating enzyme family protein [Pendulispora rubella]|uniref:Bifunctional serine/threonine-protein kinase/formylglycine-generating enzyme family protein n=1 Tax=Pendulispora rubella TaxID=2741070 RepID=A0ABZ2L0G8_9BACT
MKSTSIPVTVDALDILGRTIDGKYRVEELVGQGGFALVYRAMHTVWNKPVAIKLFTALANVLPDQRDRFMAAFIQEGALLTELSARSSNIVQARDVGTYTSPDGHWLPYMVLEWLPGVTLARVLAEERASNQPPWSLGELMTFLGPVAAALEVAHARGVAHRDIKPGNLFVLGQNARIGAVVKILDFGLAKMMADESQLQAALAKTGTNIKSFTPAYGAPEQFTRNYGATGPWTDVFALALVAVRMLTGRRALDGDDVAQLAYSACAVDRRPTPRNLGAEVSDDVERVFARALAVQTTERYASAGAFWLALEAAIQPVPPPVEQSISISAIPPGPPPPRGEGRGGGAVRIIAALAATSLIAALAFFILTKKTKPEEAAPTPATAPPAAPELAAAVVPTCPDDAIQIPAGQYFMGSDRKGAQPNEKPSHHVKLSAFCMDVHEVTAQDYKACSEIGQCRRAPADVDWPGITPKEHKAYSSACTGADPDKGDHPFANHPINCITWSMASTYCAARGKRLPTEAEWEYAARGPDGRTYPWGDEAPTPLHVNACGTECSAWGKSRGTALDMLYSANDGYPTTAPVGRFPSGKSRYGLYDVAGNVWEWVADWYGDYGAAEAENPVGPETGDRRVIRGGAWNGAFADWLLPSFRYAQDPEARSHGIGFRCAKSI